MHDITFSRRAVMLGAAALPMMREASAQARPKNIVISSSNGMAACAKAMEVIKGGGDTLDAVIAGVNIVELDPNDTSVGYGGLPNEDGVVGGPHRQPRRPDPHRRVVVRLHYAHRRCLQFPGAAGGALSLRSG